MASNQLERRRLNGGAYAGGRVYKKIQQGHLRPVYGLKCVDCGKPARCYDHRDYARPLVVAPVCHRCNLRRGPGRSAEGRRIFYHKIQIVRTKHGKAKRPSA